MKILIDTHLLEDKRTGIGRYLECLVPELANWDKKNHYHVLMNSQLDGSNILNKTPVVKTNVNLKGPSLKQHFIIPRLLHMIKPDVYHHPHFDLPLGVNVPSVITVHDLKYVRHPEFFNNQNGLKSIYMKRMLGSSIRRSKKIVAVSEATKQDILAVYGVTEDKIVVIHHGIEECYFNNLKKPLDTDVLRGLRVNRPYILFVGERRPHKNITALIKAYAHLKSSIRRSYQLVIVGKAYSNYNAPEQKTKELGLTNSIVFTNAVTDEILKTLYRNASLFVLPSLYEGFGFPVLEAMASCVPVIASNVTSLPEIVGNAGMLFNTEKSSELTEIIECLLNDESKREKYIKLGFERAKEFTWKKSAEKHVEIYQELIKLSDYEKK